MRCGSVDRLFGLCRIGKIDAAEFGPIGRRRDLRRRVIHAGHFCAPRKRRLRNHLAERARGAGHDNDFSIHDQSPGSHQLEAKIICVARENCVQIDFRQRLRRGWIGTWQKSRRIAIPTKILWRSNIRFHI